MLCRKRYIAHFAFVAVTLLFCSCDESTDPSNTGYSVRVRNSTGASITTVVGSLNFGSVAASQTTDYKKIDVGTYTVALSKVDGTSFETDITIEDISSKWTFTINSLDNAAFGVICNWQLTTDD